MIDPNLTLAIAASGLAGLAMVTMAGLSGWRGWLAFKRYEIAAATRDDGRPAATPTASARIELADLKERIRKLEAIAAGVEL